ncbi:ribonuclease III [Campylobacter sp. IFREMER_LSEM_CL1846]|uniref:ribonuclease III n=1 Tax=unclassified Campylobacter TaxID=2593542 RepID=UPI0012803E2C|nr:MULTISPECIES: ribonuclease III [unclassified Campylobacter]EAJ5678676.1 ribonuclease III [Campylobacter lari]EAK0444705.1 ribonuclease III [Campylobacter lari]EAK9943424.1 ribonuclease III [Campylobacter lari]MCV3434563.1 ribonuclease III [Campylobacter sp. IFREMER_LSEM_CL1846]MCV3530955.1 ribonuclease III [Campylobacter sp. CNRCH_2007_0968H]
MLKKLQERLSYYFKNEQLLIEALTHKSYKKPYNNERLEFLGDAVMDLVVGEFLFFKFQKDSEGNLSKLRAALVNEKSFATLAQKLDLGACIFMSIAEENNDGRNKPSILSDAFEALMGALYLEIGFEKTKNIALNLLNEVYPHIDTQSLFKDYKTRLQEITQANMAGTPEYVVMKAFGPDHKKQFEIAVKIQGIEVARSIAGSKKEAQQQCAKIALEKLGKL